MQLDNAEPLVIAARMIKQSHSSVDGSVRQVACISVHHHQAFCILESEVNRQRSRGTSLGAGESRSVYIDRRVTEDMYSSQVYSTSGNVNLVGVLQLCTAEVSTDRN